MCKNVLTIGSHKNQPKAASASFVVEAPAESRGVYPVTPADWEPYYTNQARQTLEVAPADPPNACAPLQDSSGSGYSGKAVLVRRDVHSCTDEQAVLNAQAAGAALVLVIFDHPGTPNQLQASNPASISVATAMMEQVGMCDVCMFWSIEAQR